MMHDSFVSRASGKLIEQYYHFRVIIRNSKQIAKFAFNNFIIAQI